MSGFPQCVYGEKVATEKWNITADKVIRYENPNSIIAQGNVILEKNEQVVTKSKKTLKTSAWTELLEEQDTQPGDKADQIEKNNAPQYRTTVTIKADWIVYDVELESIKAKGDVRISKEGEQLFAKGSHSKSFQRNR